MSKKENLGGSEISPIGRMYKAEYHYYICIHVLENGIVFDGSGFAVEFCYNSR